MTMRSRLMLLPLALLACGESATEPEALRPQLAAVAFTSSTSVPLSLLAFVPCAAGGAGEDVLLEGLLHIVFHATDDGAGGFHVKTHVQPQGVSGIGAVTGAKYRGTGVTQDQTNVKAGQTYTLVNNFRVIGQGRGNNFLLHQNVHVTVNANGELTAEVDNLGTDCR